MHTHNNSCIHHPELGWACYYPPMERDVVKWERQADSLQNALHNLLFDLCYECGEKLPCSKPFHQAARAALDSYERVKNAGSV